MTLSERNTAVLGLVSALGATALAAVVFFPSDPTPRGALAFPAAILAIGILIVPLSRVLSGSHEIMNAENFVMAGFVFWLLLDLLQGAYDLRDASNEALRLALVAIGVFAAAVWLGMFGAPWRLPGWLTEVTRRPLEVRTINRVVPICFALGMLNFAYACDFDLPYMFSFIGQDRFSAPWARTSIGGWGSFIDQMPYFGYVLPGLTALLIAKQGLTQPRTVLAIGLSVIMLLFLSQSGGRRLIGVTVGAALLVWLQANPGLRLKNIIIIIVSAIALAFISQFILNIRTGGIEAFRERGSGYDHLHVDDNFLRLAQMIEIMPDQRPFVGSGHVVYALVRPVPRVLWPDKPVDAGFDLANYLGSRNLSLSISIIGEWYMGWGWLAIVFGGWFHGRLAKSANVLREEGAAYHNPIVYGLAVMVLISGMRSMLDLVIMSYALVAWWAVNRVITRRTAVTAQ